jgi:hypothetical protein
MSVPATSSRAQVAAVLRRCLEHGSQVEIDGLGVFRPAARGRFRFVPQTRARVFIAYVQEDAAAAERLYRGLAEQGYEPWLDRKKLLPGQNWPRAIEQAIEVSDFFVACFSRRAVGKRGWFQSELRYALDCARRVPLGDIYLIPVRLEECRVPVRVTRELQYVDLFPDWEKGFRRILTAMRRWAAEARPASPLRQPR